MSKHRCYPVFFWTLRVPRRRVGAGEIRMPAHPCISVVVAAGVLAGAVVATSILGGCAVARAPYDWLPTVDHLAADPYGAWVEVAQNDTIRYGELVAIDADSLYFLPVAARAEDDLEPDVASHLQIIPRSTVREVRLFWFDSDWERLALTSFGGVVGSLSHGVLAGISWPFWIIGGFTSSYSRSHDPLIKYPDEPWLLLSPYARFPQGLPEIHSNLQPRRQ